MPKRKRSDYEAPSTTSKSPLESLEDPESTRAIAIHTATVQQKIHHHRILLKRALKTSKGFEQQKLGKRLKSARKDASKNKDVVERLEKEVEALKHIDLAELGTNYLNKTLLKNKKLSTSRYFPEEVAREVEEYAKKSGQPTGPAANVCARLLNANPVREAVKEVVANLSQLLGVEDGESDDVKVVKEVKKVEEKEKAVVHGKERVQKEKSSEEEEDDDITDADDSDEVVHPSMLKNLAAKYLRNGGTVSSEDDDEEEEEDEELDLDGRVAWSSEDEDDADEVSDSEDDRPRGRSMSITPIPEDELREMEAFENEDLDISLSDEHDEDTSSDSSPAEKPQKSKSKSKKDPPALAPAPTGPIKSSSFLPTLMTGYISGSESDASSDDNSRNKKKSKKGPPEKKVRKNRMGQQARRALAEKKFGTGANHIKKAKEEKEAKAKAKEERKKQWQEKQVKPVHVSWELKKKDKDEKDRIVRDMMAGKGAAGAGKKIVFD